MRYPSCLSSYFCTHCRVTSTIPSTHCPFQRWMWIHVHALYFSAFGYHWWYFAQLLTNCFILARRWHSSSTSTRAQMVTPQVCLLSRISHCDARHLKPHLENLLFPSPLHLTFDTFLHHLHPTPLPPCLSQARTIIHWPHKAFHDYPNLIDNSHYSLVFTL